ncbi:MAG: hypothetical protein JRJ72_03480, partial [Deltaproteobacteria bacterium]|nr:hypothetical protein [Deltaproteobacteria bacterium]
ADNDKYVALARYQGQDIEAGLLTAFYNFKQFPAMRDMIDFRGRVQRFSTAEAAATLGQVTYDATRAAYAEALGVTQAQLDQAIYDPYTGGTPTTIGQTINAGLISAGYDDMPTVYSDYWDTKTAYANAAAEAGSGLSYANRARAYIVDPYFVGKFGDFTLKGEFIYGWGDADFDGTAKDLDVEVMTYLFEAGYETGPFAMRGGYWYMSGDNDTSDDKHESFAYIEPNRDLDIAFLLTGDNDHYTSDLTNSLGGGIGNFSGNAQDPLGAEASATSPAMPRIRSALSMAAPWPWPVPRCSTWASITSPSTPSPSA